MDYTSVHPASANQVHHIDLHLWRGPPRNRDAARPIQIIVNQGFVVGFSPDRLQPAWSAYRVAASEDDVDYERPLHYHDDLRLPEAQRIGRQTFGKLGSIAVHVGHMTPNEVINRQFGRLAQLETFLMSNMSPQYGTLNSGVWLKLESAIRAIDDEPGKDHVWAIVGPVFGDQPVSINRGPNKHVPVPEAYFCLIVDPFQYPYDRLSNVHVNGFIIPQNAPPASNPQQYPATIAEIEARTGLTFFTDWGRPLPIAPAAQAAQAEAVPQQSRIMAALAQKSVLWQQQLAAVAEAQPVADSIAGLIESLQQEANGLQIQSRALSAHEEARLVTLQHTMSWLFAADRIGRPAAPAAAPVDLITYKIVGDLDGRLKAAARIACNFWNRFLVPGHSVVVRLGIFTAMNNIIARAYEPYEQAGVRYGVVEFNTKYLAQFSTNDTAATIVHEIGHTLGFGWAAWNTLFDSDSGRFHPAAVQRLPALAAMEIERDGGPGTAFSHWDEALFDKELMTGFKDSGETVDPVTIEVMALFGHRVVEPLDQTRSLAALLDEVANMIFSRQDEIRAIDLDHFVPTPLFETIPHHPG